MIDFFFHKTLCNLTKIFNAKTMFDQVSTFKSERKSFKHNNLKAKMIVEVNHFEIYIYG